MKNLFVRSLSGLVYVGLILGTLFIGELSFALLVLFFVLVGTYELCTIQKESKSNTIRIIISSGIIYTIYLLAAFNIVAFKWLWLLALAPIGVFVRVLFLEKTNIINRISVPLQALFYITLPLILLNQLNSESGDRTSWFVPVVFILIWINDSFAYLSGVSFGKHKMFERISPKKSWEGFAGGLLATLIGAWFFYPLVGVDSKTVWLLLASFVCAAAVLGDFVESMFKRDAGVKDSGKIMPGHGGVLDRIDSLLFVFPVVYVYLQIL